MAVGGGYGKDRQGHAKRGCLIRVPQQKFDLCFPCVQLEPRKGTFTPGTLARPFLGMRTVTRENTSP